MNGTLKLSDLTLAFGDSAITNSPQKKFADWQVDVTVPVKNPKTEPFTVPAGTSLSLFSGTRTISADNTTQWSISLSILASDRYRFTNIAGVLPALRTDRLVDLSGRNVIVTFNPNLTASLQANAGDFLNAQVGDVLFIPGPSTGDPATPFGSLNEGYWLILSISTDTSTLQLSRPTGAFFTAATETVTVADSDQVQVFSSAGVQVGDGVSINAGFSGPVIGTYQVVAVNPVWFEVVSSRPLPVAAVATPGTSGIQFFTSSKIYVEMFADQVCVLRLNGDTSDSNTITPWQAGDINLAGHFKKTGPAWSAVVVNKSQQDLNILLITAEPAAE